MANPQTEDGYTRIANELFEALLRADLSKRHLLVVLAIMRQTYGFNRTMDRISGSQMAELTGVRRNHCNVAVMQLIELKIVKRDGRQIGIQKDYDQWCLAGPKSGLEKSQNGTTQVVPKQDYDSPESGLNESQNGTKSSPKTGHTKDSKDNSKDNLKDSSASALEQRFNSWWKHYPKKRNRGQALKAWKAIVPDDELTNQMIDATERAKRSASWFKDKGQFIPYPATWLRAEGWLDELEVDIDLPATTGGACATTIENLNQLFGGTGEGENVRRANGLSIGSL